MGIKWVNFKQVLYSHPSYYYLTTVCGLNGLWALLTDNVKEKKAKEIHAALPDSPPKPQTKICSLFFQQPNLRHLTLQFCATPEHSPGTHSLRGIMGQYLGCFLSQFLSKISCMAASIAWILAASAPYSFFISAVRLSPGLSVGGATERSTLLCRSWSASTYGSSASSCCCLPRQRNHKRYKLLGYQPITFYFNF